MTDLVKTPPKNGTIPKGTYDAVLTSVANVQPADPDKKRRLRVIARAVPLDRDVHVWLDPDGQWSQDELEALVDSGEVVSVKVWHSPVGQQASLQRPAVAGEVVGTEEEAAAAHAAHQKVMQGLLAHRLGLAYAAEGCHELHVSEGWRQLGCESLTEYLAQPEITISRTQFYRLSDIYEKYVLDGGVELDLLQGAEETKLEVPLKALTQGAVSAEQAVADATSMTRKDLRAHYAAIVGDEPDDPEPDPEPDDPAGGTSEGVSVDVARSLAAMLRRVVDEIGAPEQKRMSKALRAAVLEVLALAQEHGLSVERVE